MEHNRSFLIPPVLIKVLNREYANQLVNNGTLKFGTYLGYRQIEDKSPATNIVLRSDKMEGLEKSYAGKLTFKSIGAETLNITVEDARLNIFQNKFSHLYCLYGFAPTLPTNFKISPYMQDFGDTAVIFNSRIFLKSVADYLSDLGVDFDMRYVQYYNENSAVELGPFAKREVYSYQFEYRIATNLKVDKFSLGDFLKNREDTKIIESSALSELDLLIK